MCDGPLPAVEPSVAYRSIGAIYPLVENKTTNDITARAHSPSITSDRHTLLAANVASATLTLYNRSLGMGTETLILTERGILISPAEERKRIHQRVGAIPTLATLVVAMGVADAAPLYIHGTDPHPDDHYRHLPLPAPHVQRWMQFCYDYLHSDTLAPLYDSQAVMRYILGIDETITPTETAPCQYATPTIVLVPGCGYRLVDEHGLSDPSVYCVGGHNRVLLPLYYGGPLIVSQYTQPPMPDAQFAQILPPLAM
jgi:hypothetical protein